MAKKIALLISLVMIFSFSCVFASEVLVSEQETTEPEVTTTATEVEEVVEAPEAEVTGEEAVPEDGEAVVEPEENAEVISEPVETEPVEGNAEVVSSAPAEDTESTTSSQGNGTVVGAIIAVVIVIAVVAIVAVLQKK